MVGLLCIFHSNPSLRKAGVRSKAGAEASIMEESYWLVLPNFLSLPSWMTKNHCLGIKKTAHCRAVVAHAFNPSTREAEAGGFLSSSPAWSTEWVPGQPGLHRETPSWKTKKKKTYKYKDLFRWIGCYQSLKFKFSFVCDNQGNTLLWGMKSHPTSLLWGLQHRVCIGEANLSLLWSWAFILFCVLEQSKLRYYCQHCNSWEEVIFSYYTNQQGFLYFFL